MSIKKQISEMLARIEAREEEYRQAEAARREAASAETSRVEQREKERDKRANRIVAVVGGIVGVVGPLITGGALYVSNDNLGEDLGRRVEENDRKIQRLGERSVEQEIQMVESVRYLGEKIDRASPEARTVPKPEAVVAGEKRVDELKKRQRVDEILNEPIDPIDPLKDTGP